VGGLMDGWMGGRVHGWMDGYRKMNTIVSVWKY
jgi:hypothetical protein